MKGQKGGRDDGVLVVIRVRPLNDNERGLSMCVRQESSKVISWIGQPEAKFTFDHVASETVNQEIFFETAGLPMVENCLFGYNSCMFAYGQTGSGKTYTMLGELADVEFMPSPHRGMIPRIFEVMFARFREEEESRRDEKLKYNCKCSFLEIYNDQITDLLVPTSTNLHLRGDVKKGVYVENLSEYEVHTLRDVMGFLIQGSSNRKVVATKKNRNSSRSHCVFICIIESKWERDSVAYHRFARLNLVDLAGSERQKSSGAEGERLKEAGNINRTLTTLGLVLMHLENIADGKRSHVPYRDSKLTWLLQDSLGGNSKTLIIANISPSVRCAAETLDTLKLAQRAKFMRNNAVVNEESAPREQASKREFTSSLKQIECEDSPLQEQLRRKEILLKNVLNGEIDRFVNGVQTLQAASDLKDQKCIYLINQLALKQASEMGSVLEQLEALELHANDLGILCMNMTSELQQLAQQNSYMDRQLQSYGTALDSLISEFVITLKFYADFCEQLLMEKELEAVHLETSMIKCQDNHHLHTSMTKCRDSRNVFQGVQNKIPKLRRARKKWTDIEVVALRKGFAEYGKSNWQSIKNDPTYSEILKSRSAADLKDKWRNLEVAKGK